MTPKARLDVILEEEDFQLVRGCCSCTESENCSYCQSKMGMEDYFGQLVRGCCSCVESEKCSYCQSKRLMM